MVLGNCEVEWSGLTENEKEFFNKRKEISWGKSQCIALKLERASGFFSASHKRSNCFG
jgi:hypothetical protein